MNTSISPVFVVRAGQLPDVEQLVRLSNSLQRNQVTTTKHGFLGAGFGAETFTDLIACGQLVIGVVNEQVIGYYLLNTVSVDGVLASHHRIVEELKNENKMPAVARVGIGAQACILPLYQGQGLRPQMLDLLVQQLAGRFDYAFSTISKENTRAFNAHTKDGWQVMGEDDHYHYVVLPVPNPQA